MEAPLSLNQYVIRLETELEPLSLLNWLQSRQHDAKIYWACRQEDIEVAAIGIADSIDTTNTASLEQAVSIVEERLKNCPPGVRYYGGRCFDMENVDPAAWRGFNQYRFVIPEYEIVRKQNTYTLAHNVRTDGGTDTEHLRQELLKFADQLLLQSGSTTETASKDKQHNGLSRKDFPGRAEWVSLVRQLTEIIQTGHVEKVVLAQKAELLSEFPLDPVTLLGRIKAPSSQTYTFLYQFPDSGTFLGASPECLFRKDGKMVYSEAIAGTRPMGHNQETSLELQKELQQSAKELQEHDYVADNIHAALEMLCEDVHCTERREILQTASIQHLYTGFRGQLKDKVNLFHILNALHPTAAVNGTPSREAMEHIRKLEPFSRGWYAGAVGWITASQAEFAVAIRSALVHNQTISIYSGAGIVKDSDPEQEWEETELKKRLILEAAKEII